MININQTLLKPTKFRPKHENLNTCVEVFLVTKVLVNHSQEHERMGEKHPTSTHLKKEEEEEKLACDLAFGYLQNLICSSLLWYQNAPKD